MQGVIEDQRHVYTATKKKVRYADHNIDEVDDVAPDDGWKHLYCHLDENQRLYEWRSMLMMMLMTSMMRRKSREMLMRVSSSSEVAAADGMNDGHDEEKKK